MFTLLVEKVHLKDVIIVRLWKDSWNNGTPFFAHSFPYILFDICITLIVL